MQFGILAMLLYNAHRGSQQQALSPADFFRSLKARPRKLSVQEIRLQLQGWAAGTEADVRGARPLKNGPRRGRPRPFMPEQH